MDGGRFDATLIDATLEREIERALAVDPSPEFLARVRMRIASEPAHGWRYVWPMVLTGTTAAVMVVGTLLWRFEMDSQFSRFDLPPIVSTAVGTPVTEPAPATLADRPERPGRPLRAASRRSVRPAGARNDVLIASAEATALKRLLHGVPSLSVGLALLIDSSPEIPALPPLTDIDVTPIAQISPITIEPLRVPAREEGVRQ